jgi:hypothetical protein
MALPQVLFSKTKGTGKPNIILCMADDMGWGDPGFNGNKIIKTGNLDAMAKTGMLFTRFYSSATAFLYDNARILNRVAERMGKKADAAEFDRLARQVRQDFIKAYYKPAEHCVATGSQASLATALYFDLVPKEDREDVPANLVAELEEAQYRQSTGEVCFRMLVQALTEGRRSDVVYRMINRTDAPGYGYMLKLGFKTLSETWQNWRAKKMSPDNTQKRQPD